MGYLVRDEILKVHGIQLELTGAVEDVKFQPAIGGPAGRRRGRFQRHWQGSRASMFGRRGEEGAQSARLVTGKWSEHSRGTPAHGPTHHVGWVHTKLVDQWIKWAEALGGTSGRRDSGPRLGTVGQWRGVYG